VRQADAEAQCRNARQVQTVEVLALPGVVGGQVQPGGQQQFPAA